MPNGINTLSPDFRDFLLNRNLISDTIQNNGLEPLLLGIGLPTEISHTPLAVQASTDIEVDGVFYKDLNIILNKYQGQDDDYEKISIDYLPATTNSNIGPAGGAPYTSQQTFLINNSSDDLEFNTSKNYYVDASQQLPADIIYKAPLFQTGAYLDENNNLNLGGPSTQPLDIIGSLLTGGGIGFDPNGGVASNFDVRSSLAGRVLTATGVINDTRLGQESVGFLAKAIGNNVAFNLQEETIGRINTNIRSLLTGGDIIVPNYNITVAKGTLGTAIDLLERMSGFQVPVSLLEKSSSIFNVDFPVSNIERANSMIENSGKGQVLALFSNVNENVMVNQAEPSNLRQGYAPNYTDPRINKGANTGDGINFNLYAYEDFGYITDLLNGKANNPISRSNYTKETDAEGNKFNYDLIDAKLPATKGGVANFSWGDDVTNKEATEVFGEKYQDRLFGENDTQAKKSILYKTKELFKTNNMKTIVSGYGGKALKSGIQGGVRGKGEPGAELISKGSGVLSSKNFNRSNDPNFEAPTDAGDVFCRTWSTFDRYDSIGDLVRHSDLKDGEGYSRNPLSDLKSSVLEDNGLVRIAPYKGDVDKGKIKRFMFSIENLAWADDLTKLRPCETGPGDPLSGTKGRIMWFPPYDMTFNENVTVSWDKTNFIGRGEPIHTYNNTERTGTLSWKVIIDHPNYANFFPDNYTNDEIASFFAGCLEDEGVKDSVLSQDEKDKIAVKENTKAKEKVDDEIPPKVSFKIYFPNDESAVPINYENGLSSGQYDLVTNRIPLTGMTQQTGTTTGNGTVGSGRFVYPNNTNFGLNGYTKPIDIAGSTIEGGWLTDADFFADLNTFMIEKCQYCKVKVEGFASTQGSQSASSSTNNKNNQKLSKMRADNVVTWFKSQVMTQVTITPGVGGSVYKDPVEAERYESSGAGSVSVGDGCSGENGQDRLGCKEARYAEVTIEYDPALKELVEPDDVPVEEEEVENIATSSIPVSRFFTECDYFEKLAADNDDGGGKFVFDKISDKIKYFHPSFHSITPEGFNSRLNFLHQCTRQGPTKNDDGNPQNLAFGRPPVCILRVGDFYHTKIVIDSLTIDYEPLVWDLNPEGVGVQPMIANVSINFAFIGGSSLNGPVNKLQNAISYNFFANTEVYDSRSDRIEIKQEPGTVGEAKLVDGIYPDSPNASLPSDEKPGANDGNTNTVNDNQEGVADAEANKEAAGAEPEESEDVKLLKNTVNVNFFSDNDDKLISFLATDIDLLSDGWSWKFGLWKDGTTIDFENKLINSDELTDSGKLEIKTGVKCSTVMNATNGYKTTKTLKQYYDNGEIDPSLTCYSANTSSLTIPSAYLVVSFYKDGETTVVKSKFDTGYTYFYECDSIDEDDDIKRNTIAGSLYMAELNKLDCLSC